MEELKRIIEDYERGKVNYEVTKDLMFALTGKEIEQYYLDFYWGSESLEHFIRKLSTKPITDWQQIDDERTILLLEEMLQDTCDDAIIERNGQALEKRYGKPDGTVISYIFHSALDRPDQILQELKRDTKIIL
jgi:hypothetical protein